MSYLYTLDGKTPVAEPDSSKWADWWLKDKRSVRQGYMTVGVGVEATEVHVSTVFLGMDCALGEGPPMLFETMVFYGPLDQKQERCSTWDEAEKMHDLVCERVRNRGSLTCLLK